MLISSEIENVKDYIKIYQIRANDKFDFMLDIDDNIMDKKIIKLLLQPIVENALIHGIVKKTGKCKLELTNRM